MESKGSMRKKLFYVNLPFKNVQNTKNGISVHSELFFLLLFLLFAFVRDIPA